MRPRASRRLAGRAAALALAAVGALSAVAAPPAWSEADKAVLASMQLSRLGPAPVDPSNAVALRPQAVALGQRLFEDRRLSRNGEVACASCHAPQREFQDDRPVGRGVGTGQRRTMPIAGAAHQTWLFWDGRKDSLWSQALGPLEDPAEHGANRVQLVRLLGEHHRRDYEALFGPLPDLRGAPADASPLGTPAERAAWQAMPLPTREAVDRAFANLGKAIAAYERSIVPGTTRVDRYLAAVLAGDALGGQQLSDGEVRGLRLFIGAGRCATCHSGPLLSDGHFHNTGVPPRDAARPDRGRAAAVAKVLADDFNCRSRHGDAKPAACPELDFIADDDPAMEGAFRTPGLRHVADRAPYMHAGQFATLEEVVAHYARSPQALVGRSELVGQRAAHPARQRIVLGAAEQRDLVAFLRALGR